MKKEDIEHVESEVEYDLDGIVKVGEDVPRDLQGLVVFYELVRKHHEYVTRIRINSRVTLEMEGDLSDNIKVQFDTVSDNSGVNFFVEYPTLKSFLKEYYYGNTRPTQWEIYLRKDGVETIITGRGGSTTIHVMTHAKTVKYFVKAAEKGAK